MNKYQHVKDILDTLVAGKDFGAHGPFWRGLTRDEFVEFFVFGHRLVVPGEPAQSNLLKALGAEAPFGSDVGTPGAFFRRMPADMPAASKADIEFLTQWISDGCPDVEWQDPLTSVSQFLVEPEIHLGYWRDFDNWAMFQATPNVSQAIGQFFPAVSVWFDAVRSGNFDPWLETIQDTDRRNAIELLASLQIATLGRHYGNDPIRAAEVIEGYELFGRGVLPPDPLRPQDPDHKMNGSVMWFIWSAFADATLRLGIDPGNWILHTKAILTGLLFDGLFRGRFVVDGFTPDVQGSVAVRTLIQELPVENEQILAELAKRFQDSGVA